MTESEVRDAGGFVVPGDDATDEPKQKFLNWRRVVFALAIVTLMITSGIIGCGCQSQVAEKINKVPGPKYRYLEPTKNTQTKIEATDEGFVEFLKEKEVREMLGKHGWTEKTEHQKTQEALAKPAAKPAPAPAPQKEDEFLKPTTPPTKDPNTPTPAAKEEKPVKPVEPNTPRSRTPIIKTTPDTSATPAAKAVPPRAAVSERSELGRTPVITGQPVQVVPPPAPEVRKLLINLTPEVIPSPEMELTYYEPVVIQEREQPVEGVYDLALYLIGPSIILNDGTETREMWAVDLWATGPMYVDIQNARAFIVTDWESLKIMDKPYQYDGKQYAVYKMKKILGKS